MAITPGCYHIAHMKDGPMIRVRLPGGRLHADQLRALAGFAGHRGNGLIDLTNRGNLQIRGLDDITLAELTGVLGAAGLLPDNPKADRIRNIVADPLAGLDAAEIIDTVPVAAELDRLIQTTPSLHRLVPEFEFVLDNGGRSGVAGLAHDVGLVAEKAGRTAFFRLSIAGVMTDLTVPPDRGAELAAAAARGALSIAAERGFPELAALAGYGWRAASYDAAGAALVRSVLSLAGPYESRLRRMVKSASIDDIVARIAEFAPAGYRSTPPADPIPRVLAPVVGAVEQRQRGVVGCGLGVPVGRLDADGAAALADLAGQFGDGHLRPAPWHAVFLANVPADRSRELLRRARDLGFAVDPAFVRVRVFACSGVTGCRGGKFDTKRNARAVFAAVADALQGHGAAPLRPLTVHLSGCIKGCAHRRQSDVFALERSGGYDVYKNTGPCDPPPAGNRIATVAEAELPALVGELAVSMATPPAAGNANRD